MSGDELEFRKVKALESIARSLQDIVHSGKGGVF